MNFDQIQSFIIEERDNGYLLDVWKSMQRKWKLSFAESNTVYGSLESFLSKLLEFQRACTEDGDSEPEVWINNAFQESHIALQKKNGERWRYILHPTGFQGNWEIFKVIRT